MLRNRLTKTERLRQKKVIQQLFREGKNLPEYPFLIKYLDASQAPNQVLFSVSKRKFKRAVDRNRLKRLMREAYRHNKYLIINQQKYYHLAIIYTSATIHDFIFINKKLNSAFTTWLQEALKER